MKIVFTFSLMLFFGNLLGQDSCIVIGDRKFSVMSKFNGLTIFSSSCEANYDYKFLSKMIINYDSVENIGYLGYYNYKDHFVCRKSIDYSVMQRIETLLTQRRYLTYEKGILFVMEDNNREFIGFLTLFKNKKFKKFKKKANRLTKQTFAGEVTMTWEYDYHKYAKEFILAKMGNGLSLIEIR